MQYFNPSNYAAELDFGDTNSFRSFSRSPRLHTATQRPPRNTAPSFSFTGQELQNQTIEEVFADLHASCNPPYTYDPLVLPPKPFVPYEPEDEGPSVPQRAPVPVRRSVPPPVRQQPMYLPSCPDYSSDSDSDSDSDEPLPVFHATSPDPYATPEPEPAPRATCPLPASVSPRRSTRETRAPVIFTPPQSVKRKAARASGPSSSKRATGSSRTAIPPPAFLPMPQPAFQPMPQAGPSTQALGPDYQWLLEVGCTFVGTTLRCNVPNCPGVTASSPRDMARHMYTHFPDRAELIECSGCPARYSRQDALRRHEGNTGHHRDAARKALMVLFRQLPLYQFLNRNSELTSMQKSAQLKPAFEFAFERGPTTLEQLAAEIAKYERRRERERAGRR